MSTIGAMTTVRAPMRGVGLEIDIGTFRIDSRNVRAASGKQGWRIGIASSLLDIPARPRCRGKDGRRRSGSLGNCQKSIRRRPGPDSQHKHKHNSDTCCCNTLLAHRVDTHSDPDVSSSRRTACRRLHPGLSLTSQDLRRLYRRSLAADHTPTSWHMTPRIAEAGVGDES